jgi:hypothetical protein
MPALPNPRATYKAQLLDYDALLLASDDECSYCLSEREVQILLAFVDYIAWKTRYIATETAIDTDLIRQWGANLARKLMSGCCGDNQTHRFSPAGIYQSSDDGGITWNDDPQNDPRNSYVGAPPLPGVASNAKRCASADNVRGLFEQYRDNLIEIVGATPSILAIIAGILAFIGVIAGISGVGIGVGVIFLTMAAEIVQIGGTGISAEITFTALENFKCMVYCRMNEDGELTYDAWQGLLSDIAAGFSGFAETFFYQTVNGMGYIGVTNAGTVGAATATDCDGCECDLQLEVFDGFPAENLESLGDGNWRLTSDDRADDTFTMYVRRLGGGIFYIDSVDIISGSDSPQCVLENAPGLEEFPGGLNCAPWIDSVNHCYDGIGYRAIAPFVIEIHVTECP